MNQLLKRNLVANFMGQGWVGLMSLAFIPLYIKYIGIESYALIGFFSLLNASLLILDMGLTPALSREISRFNGASHKAQSIRDLLRSMEIIGFCVVILAVLSIWAVSGLIAHYWLKPESLSLETVEKTIAIMGFVVALRFIENIYHNCLVGMQKQVLFNVINSGVATLRGFGAVGVLAWISPSIEAFFVWQGFVSLLAIAVFIVAVYLNLPQSSRRARFSWFELKNIWYFASGVMVITILSLFLMQIDKILLSRLLTLEYFGYYTLAGLVASSLYMIVAPIDQAFSPRLNALVEQEAQFLLISTFHMASQLVTVFVGTAAMVLMIFGDMILTLWTQDAALAYRVSPLLTILSLGTLINCLMRIPNKLQLSYGWTSLAVKVNTISLIILIPAIIFAVSKYGAVGAAWVWVILNLSNIIFFAHIMFRRLLRTEKWRWYIQDIAIPLFAVAVTAGFARHIMPNDLGGVEQMIALLVVILLTLLVAALNATLVKQVLQQYIKNIKLYIVKK
jgi:O-antigen/teichoic acid export membrane protein